MSGRPGARRRFDSQPPEVERRLENAMVILLPNDPQEEEHIQLLAYHPGFRRALEDLRADFDAVDYEGFDVLSEARANPSDAPYPARQVAREWGVSPAAAIAAMLMGPGEL